jgi:hypothetical protein
MNLFVLCCCYSVVTSQAPAAALHLSRVPRLLLARTVLNRRLHLLELSVQQEATVPVAQLSQWHALLRPGTIVLLAPALPLVCRVPQAAPVQEAKLSL